MAILLALFFDALAVILKIGLAALKGVEELLFFGAQRLQLIGNGSGFAPIARRISRDRLGFKIGDEERFAGFVFRILIFMVAQEFRVSSTCSEKNWAMKATAVMTRS